MRTRKHRCRVTVLHSVAAKGFIDITVMTLGHFVLMCQSFLSSLLRLCVWVCKGNKKQVMPYDWSIGRDCCLWIGPMDDMGPFKLQLTVNLLSFSTSITSNSKPEKNKQCTCLFEKIVHVENGTVDVICDLYYLKHPGSSFGAAMLVSWRYGEYDFDMRLLCASQCPSCRARLATVHRTWTRALNIAYSVLFMSLTC